MHLTHRRKLLGCVLVLLVCLLVIYKTTYLALHYDTKVAFLEWELDRCIHKQGLDVKGRLGPSELFSRYYVNGYPLGLYTVGPAVLDHSARQFTTRAPEDQKGKVSHQLSSLLWPISVTSDPWPVCKRYYDEAFVFTVSMPSREGDWYYSLHTDTFLPLYALISYRSHMGPHSNHGYSLALMPAVENYELQTVDWSSDAFTEEQQYGVMQGMVRTFAGGMKLLPLTRHSLHTGHTTCFTKAHFGVGSVNVSEPSLLRGFALVMISRLSLSQTTPTQPFVCLAKRSLTRRILNAEDLVEAVSGLVRIQVVEFDGLSYREQVSQMLQYTILVGFHGDELLNAIYMPRDSATIQLLPYNSEDLQPSKYSDIAKSLGPYLEWTNPVEENTRTGTGDDANQADTVVDVSAFVKLIKTALTLGINRRLHV